MNLVTIEHGSTRTMKTIKWTDTDSNSPDIIGHRVHVTFLMQGSRAHMVVDVHGHGHAHWTNWSK